MSTFHTIPCKACKRPIHFIRTPKGKLMPCEVESFVVAPDGVGRQETFITENGEVRKGVRALPPARGNAFHGYLAHWQNCPKFKKTRK